MTWTPRTTVAAIIEQDGRFLMVEERPDDGLSVFNQPAGHLEENEGLIDAVIRETREETAWGMRPEGLVGIYRWRNESKGDTYFRVTFSGSCLGEETGRPLDPDIIATHWMTPAEISQDADRLRSPLVLKSLDDYLAGKRYPLDLLVDLP